MGEQLQPPFGLVVLPTAWIDDMDERWLGMLRNSSSAATVNLAIMSARLRQERALPLHHVAIDQPKALAHRHKAWPLAIFEEAYRNSYTWGGYDFWFRRNRITQAKDVQPDGQQWPHWCGPRECGPNAAGAWRFAGQYTVFSACNIVARAIGWDGTVVVLGNREGGAVCHLDGVHPRIQALKDGASGPYADIAQWRACAAGASNTATRLVHVGDGPDKGIPRMSEEEFFDGI